MPGLSGLDLLEIVKKEFPTIKVSMISAYGDTKNIDQAMEFGATNFFTKPIDFESLKKEVYQIIG